MERVVKKQVVGSVTIGRSGTKNHRATMTYYEDGSKYLMIHCSCRGTASGYAQHTARFSLIEGNCKN
jgi:hypothetical protein